MDASVGEAAPGRSAQLRRLGDLLARIAADADVIAVIDDLHWADRSTLDVVTFLARRLARTGVALVLAFRSDELHRRHPLRPVLAGLERHATLDHVRLAALDDAAVMAQVAAIAGVTVDATETARVVALADGNPFHVEELLALEGNGPLPSSLRDVLIARLDRLDDATIDVLREAAVIGRQVDAGLLTSISRSGAEQVDEGLRRAVEARILVSDADGRHYRFRHALLREAVYDDLRPVDRIALHRRIAEILAASPDLADPVPVVALAERARHWLGARAEPEAFAALVEAGRAAFTAMAWAEGRRAYEEALALWDRVPDPAAVGVPRSRLLQDAAAMAWYVGDTRAALELNRRTQAEPDVRDDLRRLGRLIDHEAWYVLEAGDIDRARELGAEAVRIIPAEPPSFERSMALGTLGTHALGVGRVLEARARLEEALAMARSIGSLQAVSANLAFLAMTYADLGLVDAARAAIAEAEAALVVTATEDHFFAVTTIGPWVHIAIGDYPAALAFSVEAMRLSIDRGMDFGGGRWLTAPRAEAEFRLGDWDAALRTVAASEIYVEAPSPETVQQAVVGRVLAGRGDLTAARSAIDRAIGSARASMIDESLPVSIAGAIVELLAGDADAAGRRLRPAVEAWAGCDSLQLRAELAHAAAWTATAMAERSSRRADVGDDLAAAARKLTSELRAAGGVRDGIDPLLDLAAAWLSRRDGDDDPATWARAARELERIAYRPLAATARQGEAEASLRRGDVAAAALAIRAALAHVDAMGAKAMHEPLERLARAARITLEPGSAGPDGAQRDASAAPPDPWGLSTREREVLALVAEGRTNREIGEALYISDKTASVHVTHILVKLGVSSRTEAALLAARAGMDRADA